MKLTALLALLFVAATWDDSRPLAGQCAIKLKPLRPLGCTNGYVVCHCEDRFDSDTCRWLWICPR